MAENIKVEITRTKYPDGWNYYLWVFKFYMGVWMYIDHKPKETILSRRRAEEAKKELLEKYKD